MQRFGRFFAMIGVAVMVMVTAVDVAEARRAGGGGFGSRGTRTFQAPPATRTAPAPTAPIDRSMTQKPAGQQIPGANQQATGANRPAAQRPGMFGGLAGDAHLFRRPQAEQAIAARLDLEPSFLVQGVFRLFRNLAILE